MVDDDGLVVSPGDVMARVTGTGSMIVHLVDGDPPLVEVRRLLRAEAKKARHRVSVTHSGGVLVVSNPDHVVTEAAKRAAINAIHIPGFYPTGRHLHVVDDPTAD